MLGEQVVEAEEVAVLARLTGERRIATVVVVAQIVEPRRHLHRLVLDSPIDRRVRERHCRIEGRERPGPRIVTVVERIAGSSAIRLGRFVDVGVRALLEADHVGRVIGDDVEEDLDPGACLVDERAKVVVAAEVGVDLREVGDPVTVVTGADVVAGSLHGSVLERRSQPDRRRPESLDVVELRHQAVDVATVVEAFVGGIEAGRQPVAREATHVVGRIAVLEAVGQ